MSLQIAQVAYGYNKALEDVGLPSYNLTCRVYEDGEWIIDRTHLYSSKQEFLQAMEEMIPVFTQDIVEKEEEQ